jgi:hypothetical protein
MSLPVNANYYGAGAGVDGYKSPNRFIPDVWSGKMQVKFYAATCLSEITNNDWEGEIKDVGDTVIIRSIPNITISNYQKGMALASQIPNSTPVQLNIDKGKYFQVVIDDVDTVQSDIKLMDAFSDDAGEQMKIACEVDVFANAPAGAAATNRGNTAGAISANIRLGAAAAPCFVASAPRGTADGASSINAKSIVDHIVDIGQVLDEQNVPESGRWMVIPPAAAARIKKSDLKQAYMTGDDVSPLRNGKLGMIDRFTLYVSNNLARSGAEVTCFAGTRDAISWAAQLTKVETLRSQATFGDIMRGLNVYGYGVTKPEAIATTVLTLA